MDAQYLDVLLAGCHDADDAVGDVKGTGHSIMFRIIM